MERMANAPIRYSLALIRFPRLLTMENHVGAFQEQIRGTYPTVDEQNNQGLRMDIGQNGSASFSQVLEKLWQFADADRSHALILGPDFLMIHSGQAYEGHGPFLDRLRDAAHALVATPGMGVAHVVAIGLRAINLIEPLEGRVVSDYLAPWAVPPLNGASPAIEGVAPQNSAYIATFETAHGQLRFQSLRKPGGAFPADLASPFVVTNAWIPAVTSEDYVVLDTDHFSPSEPSRAFDPESLRETFEAMYRSSRAVFEAAVTSSAMEAWS